MAEKLKKLKIYFINHRKVLKKYQKRCKTIKNEAKLSKIIANLKKQEAKSQHQI